MKQFIKTFDYEKEEQYLTDMALRGRAMEEFKDGVYTFGYCKRGEWVYRVASLAGLSEEDVSALVREQYAKGAVLVQRTKYWVYFRSHEDFVIYDTPEKKAAVCERITRHMTNIGMIATAVATTFSCLAGITGKKSLLFLGLPFLALSCLYVYNSLKYIKKEAVAMPEEA